MTEPLYNLVTPAIIPGILVTRYQDGKPIQYTAKEARSAIDLHLRLFGHRYQAAPHVWNRAYVRRVGA